MNCNDCECLICKNQEECGGCDGECDFEHPHRDGCPDYEEE